MNMGGGLWWGGASARGYFEPGEIKSSVINIIAATMGAGALSLSWGDWSQLRPRILAALDGIEVPDESERAAAADLLSAYELGRNEGRSRRAFAQLERYWEE